MKYANNIHYIPFVLDGNSKQNNIFYPSLPVHIEQCNNIIFYCQLMQQNNNNVYYLAKVGHGSHELR